MHLSRLLIRLKERLVESDFARKIVETFATQFLLLGINFLSAVLISRALGPTLRGMYAVAMTVGAIGVQFGNLGLHSSNTYFLARDPKLLPSIVGNTMAISIGLGAIGSLVAWLFCVFGFDQAPLEGTLLYMAILWIPLGLAYMLFQNVLLGIHEVRAFNKSELFNRILNFWVSALLFWFGFRNVSVIFLVNYFSLAVGICYIFYKIKNRLRERPYFSSSFLRGSISYAVKGYIGCFIAFLVIRCDLLFVKYYLGFEQAGYYSVASNVVDIISMFPMAVGTLLFPKLSALNQNEEKLRYLKKIWISVFFIMCFCAIFLFIFAKLLVYLVYGRAFLPVVPIFLWLLPGMVFISLHRVSSNYLGAIGLPLITIFSPLVVLAAKALIILMLVPSMGVIGIAISSTICYGLMMMIDLIYIRFKKPEVVAQMVNESSS